MGLLEYDDCCLVLGGDQFEDVKLSDGEPLDIQLQYCVIFVEFRLS